MTPSTRTTATARPAGGYVGADVFVVFSGPLGDDPALPVGPG